MMPINTTQNDPNGKNPHEGGAKLDAGKRMLNQGFFSYFPNAINAVTEVSEFGASKYSWSGWKTVPDGESRYTNAAMRHALAQASGEVVDAESGLLHAAHEAWNAMAKLELMLGAINIKCRSDDQPKNTGLR